MVRDVVDGKGELVIALMREGLEFNRAGISAVHSIACLGKIETCEKLEDGKYNVVVVGTHRVHLERIVQNSPYRLVEVKLLDNDLYDQNSEEVMRRQSFLGDLFSQFTKLAAGMESQAMEIMPELDFESLVNMVAMTLNLSVEQKQALLEISDIPMRCDMLVPILQQQLEALIMVRKFEHIKPENPIMN
jgi:Lon protease-like protein